MASVKDVLDIARREIGTAEYPNGSNRTKYGRWYGMDAQPWCGQFVSWVFAEAGLPLKITTDKGFAYCPFGVKWFKDSGRWFTSNPQPGDIVFYLFKGAVSDHVGIVESVGKTGILAIEGNTSMSNQQNGGSVMRRERGYPLILGFGRPDYTEAKTETKIQSSSVSEEDEEMASRFTIEYGGGTQKTSTNEKGEIFNARTPFYGGVPNMPPEDKLGFEKAIALVKIDENDPAKGYTIQNQKGQYLDFTPEYAAKLRKLKLL